MGEQLKGRVIASRKTEPVAPVLLAKRTCRGLEGKLVHTQKAETVLGVVATAAAVRAVTAAQAAAPARSMEEKSEAVGVSLGAADALNELNPHFTLGPGRKLGL